MSMKNLLIISCLLLLSFGTMPHDVQASIEGIYKTDFSEMSLQLNGDQVIGTYDYKGGKIDGILHGNTLTGTWIQTNAKGRLKFVFADDFSSFIGKWNYNDAIPSSKWDGRKIGVTLPEASSPEQPVVVSENTVVPPEGKPEPETETIKTIQDEQGLFKPGQTAMYGDLEVTLLSLKRTDQYINEPKNGHFYAILRVRVKNLGNEEDSARIFSQLQWRNPVSGMSNIPERTTGVKLNKTRDYELPPGTEGEFEDVYMFPNHLLEADFHLSKGWTKEIARWLIPIR
ncbi:MAG: hypothetical protein ABIJ59_11035 [Pseudomonadota bacterium]